MKIVVLDGYTENPGDLSWVPLEALGEVTVYDRSTRAQLVERTADAEAVILNKTKLDAAYFAACPNVKFVGLLATGYNGIDCEAAKQNGCVVCNVPGYSTVTVAQYTFALLLELCHHVGHHSAVTKAGRYRTEPDFCYWDYPQMELWGKTLGLVGFGDIGQAVANIAVSFGMEVLAYKPHPAPALDRPHVRQTTLDEVLSGSDIVSLHCPLFPETARMIDAAAIEKMKPGAWLVNTARGGLVDEAALAAALKSGRLAMAAVDVLAQEPPRDGSPLLDCPNCIVTPHIAWASREARLRLMDRVADNLRAYRDGAPQNVVNP